MKLKCVLLTISGALALGLGAIGMFLPLLPTTPFVLLAAICFSRSNRKFYEWIKRNPYFGSYIENYQNKQGVPLLLKIKSIIFLWVSLALSMLLIQTPWVYLILVIVGVGVTAHLLLIKTKKENVSWKTKQTTNLNGYCQSQGSVSLL